MYLLIDEDGSVTEVDELPVNISWDCWPMAIEIKLYGVDCEAFELTKNGWKAIITDSTGAKTRPTVFVG